MPAEPRVAAAGPLGLLATLRLASPALPIGGFSYSQGLESAIEHGWVRNEHDARLWLQDLLALNVGSFDAPLLAALADAAWRGDWHDALSLHHWHLATRESSEQHAESLQMGYSLMQLLEGLASAGEPPTATADSAPDNVRTPLADALQATGRLSPGFAASLPWAWALAGSVFRVAPGHTVTAWLWSWLENQVMVTLKAVPLGQQAGQRLMSALLPRLAAVADDAQHRPREQWFNHAPGFALAACWHETQYSRMFRS